MPQITVDTGINTKPILNGTKEMSSAIRSLQRWVSKVSKEMNASTMGYAKAIENSAKASRDFKSQIDQLDSSAQTLRNQLKRLAETKIDTKEYAQVKKDIEETEKAITHLLLAEKKNTEEIQAAKQALVEFRCEKERLEREGKATVSGDTTQEYLKAKEKYDKTIMAYNDAIRSGAEKFKPLHLQQWEQMRTATGAISEAFAKLANAAGIAGMAITHPFQAINRAIPVVLSGLSQLIHKVLDVAKSLGKTIVNSVLAYLRNLATRAKDAAVNLARMTGAAVVNGLKKIGSLALQAGKALLGIGKSARRSNNGLASSLKMLLRYGFGIRSLFMLVRRLRSAMVTAFQNMAKAVPEVNVAISKMAASLGMLKNSMATAFQPILTAIAPLISQLMDMLSAAMTKVGMFFATLTGQDYVYKATKAQYDYAKSLDKTKKSAKEAENQLASFDKLDILKANKDNGSDTDTNAADAGGFEKIPVLDSIKNFAKSLADMFKNGEFAQLGKTLADKINGFFSSVDWEGYSKKVGGAINSLLQFYNGFMEGIDWDNIGNTISTVIKGLLDTVDPIELGRAFTQKINAVFGILHGLVLGLEGEWGRLGQFLADAIGAGLLNIKWDVIGETIGTGMTGIATTIKNFATRFPWEELGERIANGANDLFSNISWEDIADALNTSFRGILRGLRRFIRRFDWTYHGTALANGVRKFIKELPIDELGGVLTGMIKGVIDFILPTLEDKETWKAAGEKLAIGLNTLFGDTEMWDGIGETFNSLALGILEFANGALDAFKPEAAANAIKIALGRIQWAEIVGKLWADFKLAAKKFGSFLNVLFADEDNSHYDPWEKMYIPDPNVSLGTRIGKKLREAFEAIPWGEIYEELKGAAQAAFKGIGDFLVGVFNITPNEVSDAGGKAKAIAIKIGGTFQKIGEEIGALPWDEYLSAAWEAIKSAVSGLISGLLDSENGHIIVKVGAAIAALKISIPLLIAGLTKTITSAIGASAVSIGTAALLVADAFLVMHDAKEIKKIWKGYSDLIEENAEAVHGSIEIYKGYVEDGRKDLADEYAQIIAGIDTTNDSAETAMARLEDTLTTQRREEMPWYVNYASDIKEGAGRALDGLVSFFTGKKPEVEQAVNGVYTIALEDPETSGKLDKHAEYGKNAVDTFVDGVNSEVDARAGEAQESLQKVYLPDPDVIAPNLQKTTNTVVNEMTSAFDVVKNNMPAFATASVNDYFNAFVGRFTENGQVKAEYEYAINDILGSGAVDAFNNGDMTAETFWVAWNNYQNDHKNENKDSFIEFIENTTDVSDVTSQTGTKDGASLIQGIQGGINDNAESVNQAMTTTMDGASGVLDTKIGEMTDAATTGAKEMTQPMIDEWGNAAREVSTSTNTMSSDVSTEMGGITNETLTNSTEQREQLYNAWDLISSYVAASVQGMRSSVSTQMNGMSSDVSGVMGALSQIDWWSLGDNIVAGIQDGVQDNWKWLTNTVKTLANNLFIAAKNALGIHSPSALFRDGVGLMIGYGIAEGLEDSQPEIMSTVADTALAMEEKMAGESLQIGVDTTDAFDGFGDKIVDGFETLISKLQAIADSVTFRTPAVAAGTVLPYNVAAQATSAQSGLTDALVASNDDLASVVIQATNNAAMAIVNAIQRQGGGTGVNDLTTQTSKIIDEINRRARMQGTSPIIV